MFYFFPLDKFLRVMLRYVIENIMLVKKVAVSNNIKIYAKVQKGIDKEYASGIIPSQATSNKQHATR